MISEYVREQKRYTRTDLCYIMHCGEDELTGIIRRLKALNVLKTVKASEDQKDMSDLFDEDVEVTDDIGDDSRYLYVFTYVGVLIFSGRVLKCFPKYLLTNDHPLTEMKQVIKVISEYNKSKEQVINLFNGDAESKSFNLLAVILYLLNDYYSYGLYSNTENVIEVNGEGDILWERTIDENFPIIRDGKPYYIEMYTRKSVNNDTDYFHRLHATILTECSNQLEEAQLTELFDIEPLELTEESLDDFGDADYILERIRGELAMQFNTRKQLLLKTVYAYIASDRQVEELDDNVSMFGTNAFNLVWENVCAEIFNNMLHTHIKDIPVPVRPDDDPDAEKKLIDIIERPKWVSEGNKYTKITKDTLIPDTVTVHGTNFIILDAKYYNLRFSQEELRGQPGIESITKQYLYQQAYKSFIEKHGFTSVKNCFLLPTEESEYVKKGHVELGFMKSLGLEDIAVRQLPAAEVFDAYLSGRRIGIECLEL